MLAMSISFGKSTSRYSSRIHALVFVGKYQQRRQGVFLWERERHTQEKKNLGESKRMRLTMDCHGWFNFCTCRPFKLHHLAIVWNALRRSDIHVQIDILDCS